MLSAADAETTARIVALGDERKALIAEGVRDKHFNWGSLLLALGVAIAIEVRRVGGALCLLVFPPHRWPYARPAPQKSTRDEGPAELRGARTHVLSGAGSAGVGAGGGG